MDSQWLHRHHIIISMQLVPSQCIQLDVVQLPLVLVENDVSLTTSSPRAETFQGAN
jgi:hypothetical protein